eukprot:5761991-Prymnesium_polylepis.1
MQQNGSSYFLARPLGPALVHSALRLHRLLRPLFLALRIGATPPAAAWHWEGRSRVDEFGPAHHERLCGLNRKRGSVTPLPQHRRAANRPYFWVANRRRCAF